MIAEPLAHTFRFGPLAGHTDMVGSDSCKTLLRSPVMSVIQQEFPEPVKQTRSFESLVVCLVLSCDCRIRIQDNTGSFVLSEGAQNQVSIHAPNTVHCLETVCPARLVHVVLDPSGFPQLRGRTDEIASEYFFEDPRIAKSIHRLVNLLQVSDSTKLESALEKVVNAVATRTLPERSKQKGLTANDLKAIDAYIAKNLASKILLEDLAEVVNFSSFHFARLFKSKTGFAPHQYLSQARMKKAVALLEGTDLPIGTVAKQVGLLNQSHLSKHTRRALGLAPNQIRKRS